MDHLDSNGNQDEAAEAPDDDDNGKRNAEAKVGNGHPLRPPKSDTHSVQVKDAGSPPPLPLPPASPSSAASTTTLNNEAIQYPNSADAQSVPNNDNHSRRSDRRPSLPERRNFRAPLSAPRDSQNAYSAFGQQHNDGGAMRPSTRKTSLPVALSRPAELDLTPAGVGSGGRPPRNQMRLSESVHVPFDFSHSGQDTMPKSVSDNRLRHSSASSSQGECVRPETQLRDTEIVVQTFMTAAYQRDVVVESDEESPVAAEVSSASAAAMTGIAITPDLPPELQRAPLSPTAEVGRRLALLADEFDQRYRTELDDMALSVLPYILGRVTHGNKGAASEWSLTFEVFRNVARRLFENCQITWGRIVALLSFGYRLTVAVLRANLPSFVSKIINLVSRFIVVEPIANWIYSQGGWIQALFFQPAAENPRLRTIVEVGYWSVQVVAGLVLAWNWLTKQ